jgi:hypothetical protein
VSGVAVLSNNAIPKSPTQNLRRYSSARQSLPSMAESSEIGGECNHIVRGMIMRQSLGGLL